jgi:hypothetical protein
LEAHGGEMKHKASKDIEKSLRENITLLHRNNLEEYVWLTFEEIRSYLEDGYEIFNNEKRELYGR